MTTVINNPGGASDGGSGMGVIVGVLVGIVVVVLFFMYALPAIRGNRAADNGASGTINVNLPGSDAPAPSGTGY